MIYCAQSDYKWTLKTANRFSRAAINIDAKQLTKFSVIFINVNRSECVNRHPENKEAQFNKVINKQPWNAIQVESFSRMYTQIKLRL